MKFLSALQVEIQDGFPCVLVSPLSYQSNLLAGSADGGIITAPVGFTTDFASIPQFLWAKIPPIGKHTRPAVIHDYLYRTNIVSRELSDQIFHEAMQCLEVDSPLRALLFGSVRVFGAEVWDNYRHGRPETR